MPQAIDTKRPRTSLDRHAVSDISDVLRRLLADTFCLYIKTKSFHWHMTGRHFRDYHLLLDEHAEQIFAITDDIAERARKLGGSTLKSIGDIHRHQRIKDNERGDLSPREMLSELHDDNAAFTRSLREAHATCEKHEDFATTSMIEIWIDQSERRTWFLSEIVEGLGESE